MIDIIGPNDISEYESALWLKSIILDFWPETEHSADDRIKIYVAGKLFGYERRDFDLVLIADFQRPKSYRPRKAFRNTEHEPFVPQKCDVWSLFSIFEVKRHGSRAIRFDGLTASVKYRVGGREVWENASEQSHEQLWTIKEYLKDQHIPSVFPSNFVLFPNVRKQDLPSGPHNFITGDMKFVNILDSLGETSRPLLRGKTASLSAAKRGALEALFDASMFRQYEPSPLDRRKMDMIARTEAHRSAWFEDLGNSQVLLTGRGGAGKTVLMLQMAYRAFQERGARSLFLTYNHSLIADVRRTMAIFQIPNGLSRGGIKADSVMSFVYSLMKHFDLLDGDQDFLEDYKELGRTFLEYLETGTIEVEEIEKIMNLNGDRFGFDYVFIDEGQDWTQEEVRLIKTLYEPNQIVVADGMDQLVRGEIADWRGSLSQSDIRIHRLRRCLRMKANLARFCNSFAKEVGLVDWNIQPNDDAGGGRISIVVGKYNFGSDYDEKFCEDAYETGNKPVDLLVCVPPSYAKIDAEDQKSYLANTFEGLGRKVWDGLSEDGRKSIPSSVEAFRLVQYDSCRGLEGWAVFALAFDKFWEFKTSSAEEAQKAERDFFISEEDHARQVAARWLMIVLTRAIDHLVINIENSESEIGNSLRNVYEANNDFVEWYE
jgi:hypothetical protein